MNWSWKLGTIAGVEIKVHAAFLLAVVWGAVMWGGGRLSGLAYGALLTLVLFSIVLLHELGHALAARRYGIPVQDIVLLPIGGVARLSRMPEKPTEELVVALAGPAVNGAFILLLVPVLLLSNNLHLLSGGLPAVDSLASPNPMAFATFLFMVNVSLLLFNLIPAFPLDGGRVLRALLGFKLPFARATGIAVMIGRGLAIILGLYGLLTFNFLLAFVALFIFAAAAAEGEEVAAREHLRRLQVTEVLDRRSPVLAPELPAHLAFERLLPSHQPAMAVVGQDGGFLGMVTAAGIQRRWREGVRGPVSDYVEQPGIALDCSTSLEVARQQMLERNAWVASVYCGGKFAGLLDLETMRRILALRRNAQRAGRSGGGTIASA